MTKEKVTFIIGIVVIIAAGAYFAVTSSSSSVKNTESYAATTTSETTAVATSTPKTPTVTTKTPTKDLIRVQVDPVTPRGTTTPAPSAKTFTMAEIALHNDSSSCYTAVSGKVYDLTSWISQHPGGERNILKICGKDGTEDFSEEHGADPRAKSALSGFLIGSVSAN